MENALDGVTPRFSVLVNSSAGYRDCWEPFFRLFALQWPDCPAPVFLNSGGESWACAHRPVECVAVPGSPESRANWSDSLIAVLDQISTPIVLYLQEDYFFHAPVNGGVIDALVDRMVCEPAIRHIGLTHFGALGSFQPTDDPRLWRIGRYARYRVSTQAALWRKDALRSYLRPGENGWMFEIFGTLRARRRNELFLTVNRDLFGPGNRVCDYLHTGIVKGRWHPGVPAVFERFGLSVDFTRRGFYRQPGALARRLETLRAAMSDPGAFLSSLLSVAGPRP